MNKHIKKALEILTDNPTYQNDQEAELYLIKQLTDGTLKPRFKTNYAEDSCIENFKRRAITLTPYVGVYADYNPVTDGDEEVFTVHACIHEDYYEWINFFIITSPQGDYMFGDFENIVYASSQKFYDLVIQKDLVGVWDYGDI